MRGKQPGRPRGHYALRRRHVAKGRPAKVLRLFGHLPQPSVVFSDLFASLPSAIDRKAVCPGNTLGAKEATQKRGNEEKTHQKLIHAVVMGLLNSAAKLRKITGKTNNRVVFYARNAYYFRQGTMILQRTYIESQN
jgi:hypothetical protein